MEARMWMRNLIITTLIVVTSPAMSSELLSPEEAMDSIVGKWWNFKCPPYGVEGIGSVDEDGSGIAKVTKAENPIVKVIL
jgi:hypothetical protein